MSSITELPTFVNNVVHYDIPFGVRVICDFAFSGATGTSFNKLESINIPTSVSFIGRHAFYRIVTLNNVIIPNSVVYLGYACFDCDEYGACFDERRKEHLCITIPPSVLKLDGNPFCNKTKITNYNDRFRVVDNVLYSSDMKTLYSYCQQSACFEVPDGVEVIAKGAFHNSPIKNIILPNTLKVIEECAFADTSLENLVLPESLKEIQKKAFDWCTFSTKCITLPSKIEFIDPEAFAFGWYIKLICVPKGRVTYYQSILPDWVHNQICDEEIICASGLIMNKDKTEIIAATEVEDKIVVPEGIEVIRNQAFDSIYTIGSIVFPRSLKNFSDKMFDDEVTINHIYVPKGTKSFFSEKLSNFEKIIQEILDSDTI